MKNICAFLMFMLSVCGGFSAYATNDIAADAESSECTENITGTYSGDANFKAKWTPNVVQLNWYNNHTLMQGVNTESNTCNYGGALTIPTTPPERIGYIFDGWKVRPKMSFTSLAIGENALTTISERWAKTTGVDRCYHKIGTANASTVNCKTDSEFNVLNQKEWKVEFRSGTTKGMLYGSAYCSAKSGRHTNDQWNTSESFSTYDELEIATGEKKYCWCQATGWQPENSSTIYANSNNISWGNVSVSSSYAWVFYHGYTYAYMCNQDCTFLCVANALNFSAFRRALFVGAGE